MYMYCTYAYMAYKAYGYMSSVTAFVSNCIDTYCWLRNFSKKASDVYEYDWILVDDV